jgi:adenylosuccinate lyase
MMIRKFSALLSIGPLDGRYKSMLDKLPETMSESGLIRNRIRVEVSWFVHLAKLGVIKNSDGKSLNLTPEDTLRLEGLWKNFTLEAAEWVKAKEKETNHDLKAVEYYIKSHSHLKDYSEYFHILCTSEDINNLAYSLMFQEATKDVLLPVLEKLQQKLEFMANEYYNIPMLSRTHGQPASPTTVGKELGNFAYRLHRQIKRLAKSEYTGKCNGAVGNFNVHVVTFPSVDWIKESKSFVETLGLGYSPYTTQIEPHDTIAEVCSVISQLNTVLLGFVKDIWGYISLGYFKSIIKDSEVGSSTMPHKVNPIDFENAEGNLGLSNCILVHLQHKLPVSRFQRDLSDSTAIRNIGVGLGHALVAYKSILKGLDRLNVNYEVLDQELSQHWEILAEPIQMILRKFNYPQPYELLKAHTRGKGNLNETQYKDLVNDIIAHLNLRDEVIKEILGLTPHKYTGLASFLALDIKNIKN